MSFEVSLVQLGHPGVGKSTLIQRYLTQNFNPNCKSTGIEQFKTVVKVGGASCKVNVWDVGGFVDLNRIKKVLDSCNIFFLTFSIVDETSFEKVKMLYESLKYYHTKENYFCLVGCKGDLRDNEIYHSIPEQLIEDYADQLNLDYQETSAKENQAIINVFNTAFIFHYKKHISIVKSQEQEKVEREKKLTEHNELNFLMSNSIPISEILTNSRLRNLYMEDYKRKDPLVLSHLTDESNLDMVFDVFFTSNDGPVWTCVNSILLERVPLFLDALSTHFSILKILFSKLSSPEFSKLDSQKKNTLIKLFFNLFDTNSKHLLEYLNQENPNNPQSGGVAFLRNMILESYEYGKLELVFVILKADKLYSVPLIQNLELGSLLCEVVNRNTNGIEIADQLLKFITNEFESLNSIKLSSFGYSNYKLLVYTIQSLLDPSLAHDASNFFCDHLLGLPLEPFHFSRYSQIIDSQSNVFLSLLTSPLNILKLAGLKVTLSLLKNRFFRTTKQLLHFCLDLLFLHYKTVLHYYSSEIFLEVIRNGESEVLDYLLQEMKLIDIILGVSEEIAGEGPQDKRDTYAHLKKTDTVY
uniref:Uncharacterized protein n=1 Tax=Arcella intermedia TaxID=1963864 RepID=A0A6B2L0F4_9EUKA